VDEAVEGPVEELGRVGRRAADGLQRDAILTRQTRLALLRRERPKTAEEERQLSWKTTDERHTGEHLYSADDAKSTHNLISNNTIV